MQTRASMSCRCAPALLVLLSIASHAGAQPRPEDPTPSTADQSSPSPSADDSLPTTTSSTEEHARALFDDAVRLVESGRPDDALVVFEEAFTLAPRASTAYNIAWVLFSQGRARAALYALDRAEPFPMSDAERESIDALRARLRPELATVVVHVSPTSATICVDDACDSTTSPVRTIVVDEGVHLVTCRAERHAPTETTITSVAGSTARVELTLVRLPDVPEDLLLDDRRAATHRRRVRRGVLISTGVGAALAAGLLAAFLPRDTTSAYSGIDLGARP